MTVGAIKHVETDGAHGGRDEAAFISVSRAAAMLSLSRSTLYEWIATGRLPGVYRLGGRLRINVRALQAWLAAQRES